MTLYIKNTRTGKVVEYHYMDATLVGNNIVVQRDGENNDRAIVYSSLEHRVVADEGDHIYTISNGKYIKIR